MTCLSAKIRQQYNCSASNVCLDLSEYAINKQVLLLNACENCGSGPLLYTIAKK